MAEFSGAAFDTEGGYEVFEESVDRRAPQSWLPFFDGHDADAAEAGNAIAWLACHALDAPPARWLGLSGANTALTVIGYGPGLPPNTTMFNEMSHQSANLQWTRFPTAIRP